MKKLALCMLTLTSLVQAETTPVVNAVDAIMDAPKIVKFTDLSGWQHAGIAAGTAVSSAISYVVFLGIANALGYNNNGNPVNPKFFEPSKWLWVEKIGALTGAGLGAYASYNACMPQSGWQEKDREVLTVILSSKTEKELLNGLDLCFIGNKFGRSGAFNHLVALTAKLKTTKEIFARVNKTVFAEVITTIDNNINAINQALLVVKNQPSWLEESKAYALTSMAHTQQSNHNAQLLGSAVLLAHK